jgi:pimeloyl-ACP methyl ester carboxylesterase
MSSINCYRIPTVQKESHMNKQKINLYRSLEDAFFKAYQVEPKEYNIEVEKYGINIRVQTIGNGQPLLFIHGGPNAGTTWVQLASLMREYTCILLDRPGCGLSGVISYQYLSNTGLTDIIVSVIDSLLHYFFINKLPVVASSLGGYMALKYTLQRPDRVSKLILEGCPAMIETSVVPQFMKMMLAPVIRWFVPILPTTKSIFKKILKKLGHTHSINNNLVPEVFIDWYVSLFNNTDTQKNDLSLINKVMSKGNMNPEFILYDSEIEKINHPILLLWGKDDPFGGIITGNRLNSKIKNSILLSFDYSGHLPWVDKPESHANVIKQFIGT